MKYLEFRSVVQEEMTFKNLSYLKLLRPFCSAEQYRLCNIGRGHYERNSVNLFRIWASGSGRDFV